MNPLTFLVILIFAAAGLMIWAILVASKMRDERENKAYASSLERKNGPRGKHPLEPPPLQKASRQTSREIRRRTPSIPLEPSSKRTEQGKDGRRTGSD